MRVLPASLHRTLRTATILALSGAILSSSGLAPAYATPGSGFGPAPISTGKLGKTNENSVKPGVWNLNVMTNGDSTVGLDQLTVQGGGYSGWHSHTGIVIATVQSGTILWTDAETCTTKSYSVGETFVEPANRPHYVRNASASSTATYSAVQIRPLGTPGRVDETAPYNNCGL
ncbi:cupin domain-containing protein [Qipengyuania sp. RANM35]|uniref:cupin domain-containing protein n=1 Tax=Qipengyuania sp. RANM35 TaxID=3068635 RepID=UPI0034DB7A2A